MYMTVLADFARTLVSHVANSAKESISSVDVALDTWKKEADERQAGLDTTRETYISEYESVRGENSVQYSMYVTEQQLRKRTWRESGQSSDLDAFVRGNTYPQQSRTDGRIRNNNHIQIYTQFYLP